MTVQLRAMLPRLIFLSIVSLILFSTITQGKSSIHPSIAHIKALVLTKMGIFETKIRPALPLTVIKPTKSQLRISGESEEQEETFRLSGGLRVIGKGQTEPDSPSILGEIFNEVSGSDNASVGAQILHIIVLIVAVLAGIGIVVAILAFVAFLINYFKRRFYVRAGKRPGREDLLLPGDYQRLSQHSVNRRVP